MNTGTWTHCVIDSARNALANLEPDWKVRFSEKQLNAYFQQDYQEHGGDANLPEGFSAPRVKIENGTIRVAVRQRTFGLMYLYYSLEMKVWLVPDKSNVVALEIVSVKAGAIPLSTSALLDYISQVARHQNTDVTWYRYDGHPVAVMRFQSDLTRPTLQFDRIDIEDGVITVAGRSMSPYSSQRK